MKYVYDITGEQVPDMMAKGILDAIVDMTSKTQTAMNNNPGTKFDDYKAPVLKFINNMSVEI